jgi:hypothetical protein
MAELSFIKTSAGLVPHTDHDREIFNKWKIGALITGKFSQVRSYQNHKRLFALLNLTFDYWEPEGGILSKSERQLSSKIFKMLDDHNGNNGYFLQVGRDFLTSEIEERKSKIDNIYKSFDVFRKWAIKEAGFVDTHQTPTGTIEEARSINFAKMDEFEFRELYKSVFNVCWHFVLSRSFSSEQEAEEAALNLLNFT